MVESHKHYLVPNKPKVKECILYCRFHLYKNPSTGKPIHGAGNQNSSCLWGKGLTERGDMLATGVYAFVKTQGTVNLKSVMSVFVHYA